MISRSRFEGLRLTIHKGEGTVSPEDIRSCYLGSYREEEERTAFVVDGTAQMELAGLFKRMAEYQEFPPDLRVFPDLPSAIHWLFPTDWATAMEQPLSPSHEKQNPS